MLNGTTSLKTVTTTHIINDSPNKTYITDIEPMIIWFSLFAAEATLSMD